MIRWLSCRTTWCWRRRSHPFASLALTGVGLGLIAFTALADPAPRLVWNASASAPIGLYRVQNNTIERGDLVLVDVPDAVRRFAAERGYLPETVPLVKRVAARSDDDVCTFQKAIIINGKVAAQRLETDGAGRSLPWWTGCRELADDEVFLLTRDAAGSFDSRYFGPVSVGNIVGKLVPMWTD